MLRRTVHTAAAPKPIGPYGQGIATGDLVFTVGAVGNHPTTSELVTGGIRAELDQALANLSAILHAAGSGFDQLVKATVFLSDIRDEPVALEALSERLASPVAVTVVSVTAMPLGAAVEIELVAFAAKPHLE